MNNTDNKYLWPAVPPLYPTNPCKRMPYIPDPILDDPYYGDGCHGREPIYYEPQPIQEPIYYEPQPIQEPIYYEPAPIPHKPYMPYPDYSMMDPQFMECVKVCMMMRCGNHKPYEAYSVGQSEPVDTEYEKFKYINLHKLSPYYTPDSE
jgi:hypothetical protein